MNALVIARNTLGDALRKKVLLIFMLLALVFLFLALMLNYFTAREQMSIFISMAVFIIMAFGAMIAITTAVFLIPNEIENRTIHSVLSKPIKRWEFFIGKFLGGILTLGISVGLMAIVVMAVAFVISYKPPAGADPTQAVQQAVQTGDWVQRGLVQAGLVARAAAVIFFELSVLTAIATTLSLYLSATVNFSITAFIFVVGSFQDIIAAWGNRSQDYQIVPYIAKAFYFVMPHFQDFNIMGSIVHPEVAVLMSRGGPVNDIEYAIMVSLYGITYAAVILLLGIQVFERKEV